MDENGGERRGNDQIPKNVPEQIAYADVLAKDHIVDVARDTKYGYSDQCSGAYFCVIVDLLHAHAFSSLFWFILISFTKVLDRRCLV